MLFLLKKSILLIVSNINYVFIIYGNIVSNIIELKKISLNKFANIIIIKYF